ncbi:MAG: hypothetical protein ACJ8IK_08745, partial [Burkholderiaceae bacterium]
MSWSERQRRMLAAMGVRLFAPAPAAPAPAAAAQAVEPVVDAGTAVMERAAEGAGVPVVRVSSVEPVAPVAPPREATPAAAREPAPAPATVRA